MALSAYEFAPNFTHLFVTYSFNICEQFGNHRFISLQGMGKILRFLMDGRMDTVTYRVAAA